MSMQVFMLPDLGEGLTEAELVNWLVKVGDSIHVDQPIAELETAKSVVEVPSPYEGVVATLHGAAGEVLEVGKPLISVAPHGAVTEPAAAAVSTSSTTTAVAPAAVAVPAASAGSATSTGGTAVTATATNAAGSAAAAKPADGGSGNVLIGYGTPGHGGSGRTRPAKRTVVSTVAGVQSFDDAIAGKQATVASVQGTTVQAPVASVQATSAASAAAPSVPQRAPLVVSPLVRKLASDNGLALAGISGTGAHGLILRRDVEAAIAAASAPAGAAIAAATETPAEAHAAPVSAPTSGTPAGYGSQAAGAVVDPRTGLGVQSREPLTGLRRAVATNLSRSRREIPEATVWVDVDATELVELRRGIKARDGEAPSLMAFISRFAMAGLARFPQLNTRLDAVDGVEQLVSFDGVNMGFAAQTERGLVVPVVRGADKLSARGLDKAIRDLAGTARSGKASIMALSGGTFTVNNYGVFGVDGSAAIINHPEVAMLGIGRILAKPWVVDGALAVRQMTELTLAFDHRVCDGGTAAGFLRFVADAMESPASVLADL